MKKAARMWQVGKSLKKTRAVLCLSPTVAAAVAIVVWAALFFPGARPLSFDDVREGFAGSDVRLLDRNGETLHQLRVSREGRRLDWVALDDISPAFLAAIVGAEDRRFHDHRGVDWLALAGALAGLLDRETSRGASTITMQLASQLDGKLQPRSGRRSHAQKFRQMRAALALERRWSKRQILEAYLNLVTFRGELQGIAAGSGGLFSKSPHGLNETESLILAALVRSPNAGAEAVAARACRLADALGADLDRGLIRSRALAALSRPYVIRHERELAPHVAQLLFRDAPGTAGRQVVSTLDAGLQEYASEVLRRHLLSLRSRHANDGALVAADNRSGEVLAYVGNQGAESSARHVDGVRARRQAGSTLKPFLYGLALDRRLLTAASLLDDSPLDLPAPGGIYRPRNYDDGYHGPVTARVALGSSLNIPAVRVLNLAGVEAFVDVLRSLGFEGLREADFYGSSLALGSADVSLWELTNAYRSLANGGAWRALRLTPEHGAAPARRALSVGAAFILSDILADRESRSRTFSLESPLSTRFWTAVKTGTSKEMRDNWCIGYSEHYTVGVWIGNFSGEPMWNVSGISGAAPAWVEVMEFLHRDLQSVPPDPPAEVLAARIGDGIQRRAAMEWFLRGTEGVLLPAAAAAVIGRIDYPAEGTIVALDPDIPEGEQKMFFAAQPAQEELRWVLNGRPVGNAGSLHLWAPSGGKHTLSLVGPEDRVLDTVRFEVRGRLAAPPPRRP